jgi:hypothetical protein
LPGRQLLRAHPPAVKQVAHIAVQAGNICSTGGTFCRYYSRSLSLRAPFYGSDNLTMREIVLWSMFGLLAPNFGETSRVNLHEAFLR